MLNVAFDSKLALEDEGYESGSEHFNITTPQMNFRIHHISGDENISFNPLLHAPQLPASHITSLYATSYP